MQNHKTNSLWLCTKVTKYWKGHKTYHNFPFQNVMKLGVWVWKQAIWQPWPEGRFYKCSNTTALLSLLSLDPCGILTRIFYSWGGCDARCATLAGHVFTSTWFTYNETEQSADVLNEFFSRKSDPLSFTYGLYAAAYLMMCLTFSTVLATKK
jgi:hypothetical protein